MQDTRQKNGQSRDYQLPAVQEVKLPAAYTQPSAVAAATESVTEIIRASRMQIESVISDVSQTLKECDAELETTEKINIIFEPGRTVFSIERSTKLGQEKHRW